MVFNRNFGLQMIISFCYNLSFFESFIPVAFPSIPCPIPSLSYLTSLKPLSDARDIIACDDFLHRAFRKLTLDGRSDRSGHHKLTTKVFHFDLVLPLLRLVDGLEVRLGGDDILVLLVRRLLSLVSGTVINDHCIVFVDLIRHQLGTLILEWPVRVGNV